MRDSEVADLALTGRYIPLSNLSTGNERVSIITFIYSFQAGCIIMKRHNLAEDAVALPGPMRKISV